MWGAKRVRYKDNAWYFLSPCHRYWLGPLPTEEEATQHDRLWDRWDRTVPRPGFFSKLLAFPTWFLVWLSRPYRREGHPWRSWDNCCSLRDWTANRTELTREFDQIFWFLLWVLVFTLLNIFVF